MRRVDGGCLLAGIVVLLGLLAGPASAADCPNAEIRAQQGVEGLPACMALEMASPPRKFLQNAQHPQVSADGSRVVFTSRGALGDPPGSLDTFNGDIYVASRADRGWGMESVLPERPEGSEQNLTWGWHGTNFVARSFSPDFSRWLALMATSAQVDVGVGRVFSGRLGGAFEPVSPLLTPLDRLHGRPNVELSRFEGASADHSRVFFRPGELSTAYLPGDPSPAGSGAEENAYMAGPDASGGPGLELLARDGDGREWGGRCGARLGGMFGGGLTNGRSQGAVSADGGRVYFSTRPSQPGGVACDSVSHKLRVMRRVQTGEGPWISQLSVSECGRVAPACDTTDGDDLYQGASVDGSKVYFTSTRQLADSDLDAGTPGGVCTGSSAVAGCDLYLYDAREPAGERIVQVSAGDQDSPTPGDGAGVLDGIAAISGDGSHVYYVANGVLTDEPNAQGESAVEGRPNLYLYQRDQAYPDGRTVFVVGLAASDGGTSGLWGALSTFKGVAYPVPASGTDSDGNEVGGDGHVLVFQSEASLTADDTDGGARDVYRYDSSTGQLIRVSKAAPGGSDNAPVNVGLRALVVNHVGVSGTDFAEHGRWVSEDGQSIAMTTDEGWAADDGNAAQDDYLWREGQIYRLPGTTYFVAASNDTPPVMSHDGSVVAFGSRFKLLPEDGDQVSDIYVARVGGGVLATVDGDCDALADSCQRPGAQPVGTDSKTSSSSGGNVDQGERQRLALRGMSRSARRRAARTGVVVLRVRTSRGGRISVVATGRLGDRVRRLGRATKTLAGPGATTVRFRLGKRARDRLAAGLRLRLRLEARAPGARSKAVAVTLRRAGK